MPNTAKLFRLNRSQAVRLPKEFAFAGREVYLRRDGEDVIVSARPADWSGFLSSLLVASRWFMAGVGELPVQERGY